MSRHEIAQHLAALSGYPGVTTVSRDAVAAAIATYAEAGDFADLLHLALAAEHGASALATFDRNIASIPTMPVTADLL